MERFGHTRNLIASTCFSLIWVTGLIFTLGLCQGYPSLQVNIAAKQAFESYEEVSGLIFIRLRHIYLYIYQGHCYALGSFPSKCKLNVSTMQNKPTGRRCVIQGSSLQASSERARALSLDGEESEGDIEITGATPLQYRAP